MISSLVVLATVGCSIPATSIGPVGMASPDSLAELYQSGRTWQQFFEAAKSRKATWTDNYDNGAPAAESVERAKAVAGSWRVLVVAEDWCGDSANTVPYLVRLVEQVPTLELRIVNSTAGKWVMERHRTPDGRAATPTIVLLDSEGSERGCFVERPEVLRAWLAETKPTDLQKTKLDWYRSDRGKATVVEFIGILEAAASGETRCGGGS